MKNLLKGVFVTIGENYSEIWRVKAHGADLEIQKTVSDRDQENALKSEMKTWPKVLLM